MNKYQTRTNSQEISPTLGKIKLGNYRYSKDDVLGYGFESVVYKGIHATKKFQVAIKAVDTTNLKDGINKMHFENQIRCLQLLKSTPHILNLLQKIEQGGHVFLVTQLCTGDLSDEIQNILSQQQIWQYMKQLSKGFMHLWKQNIIHRDIKPKNLFINSRKDIKYGDFGFAVKQNQLYKQKKYNVGSPAYMAPQAFKYNQYSHASDIWAIGIIFYQMWTGKLPWNCTTQQELQARMNDNFIQSFIKKGPFDQRAKHLLSRALKVDPKQRMTGEQLMQFFNEKKKQQIGKRVKPKPINKPTIENIQKEEDSPLQLTSPLWQFKKKVEPKDNGKQIKGFSITLQSTQQEQEPNIEQIRMKNTSDVHVQVKRKRQGPIRNFEKKSAHMAEPQTALRQIKKSPAQLFSPNVRNKPGAKKSKTPQTNPNFIIKYLMNLAENCFDLFVSIEKYPNSNQPWTEHFPMLKIAYKNLIVKTTMEIVNIQSSSKFLSQFCSTADIKHYIQNQQYAQTREQCESLIEKFKQNSQINTYWTKAKQKNFLGTLNSTISFLEALKLHLKQGMKNQLEMALTGSLIASKIAHYLSSSLQTLKNQKDDSATIKLNKNKIIAKIDEAIESRKNLFD